MASAYTPEQIVAWEDHVELPTRFRKSQSPELTIEYLTSLHVHQIAAAPYENLLLHYSPHHSVSLDPQVLFKKIVLDKRGRGGYCMENSLCFNHILKGLGFEVYAAGVRIRPRYGGVPKGDYTGWVHIVNIVTLPDGEKYMVDIGFGGDGATKPLPLVPNTPTHNLGTQEIQLSYSNIPPQTTRRSTQKFWIYQYRNSPTAPWNDFYAFAEFEFFPNDFEVMNFYTSTSESETNFQTRRVLVIRFLREGERIVGKVMLVDGLVKRNLGGKTETVVECKTENERVKALEEHFAIMLTEEERDSVRGRNVDLGGGTVDFPNTTLA
ncbi:arylamine N-acetyltransferase 1 [Bisporella sp. PMI_857]|nr:arylamine N-acetyltransferase 1 [Bisporella sp. PMI_857]